MERTTKPVFLPLICTLLAIMSVLSACSGAIGRREPVKTTTTTVKDSKADSSVATDPDTDITTPVATTKPTEITTTILTTTGNDNGTTSVIPGTDPDTDTVLMQNGSRGDDVKQLQRALIKLGWLDDTADGVFGAKTENAVRIFQKYNSLKITGSVNKRMTDLLYSQNAPAAPVTHDHKDVEKPDRKTDYYIIVYNQNCRVLVLGKDDFGKYNVVVKSFICSVGIGGDDSTPDGVFKISKRYDWRTLFGTEPGTYVYGQYTVKFNGNILFHSVPYKRKNKESLKMEEFAKLGTPASQGCVRLCVRDAKWIYDNCVNDTQVRVLDGKDGPIEYEAVPPVIDLPAYAGWDPTDPDKNSPYNK